MAVASFCVWCSPICCRDKVLDRGHCKVTLGTRSRVAVTQKSLHDAAMNSFCTSQVKEGFMARFLAGLDVPVAHDEMILHWDENPALEIYLF